MTSMDRISEGMFARSKAGHDKGRLYVIARTEGDYVFLTDGRLKPLSGPKKKKIKHIQAERKVMDGWEPERTKDEDVRRAIRLHEKENEDVKS